MNIPNELYALLQFAHVLGGVVWLGFSLYNYLVATRVDIAMPAASLHYQLGVAKHTRFGQIMGVAAAITTIVGLLLWGFGAHRGLSSAALAILGTGTLTGLLAFGHGFFVGKRNDAFAKALISAESNGQIAPAKQPELTSMMNKLSRMANVGVGLMVFTLLAMSIYDRF